MGDIFMLLQKSCTKTKLVTEGITLEAGVGESFRIRAIYTGGITAPSYLTVKIDNFTSAFWRVYGRRGNQLGCITPAVRGVNLMRQLVERGLKFMLPIAEGQKLVLPACTGTGYMVVLYDRYSAGDVLATEPNGTLSKVFSFIQYLDAAAVLSASGDMALDTALTPAEFPNFPADAPVPPKMRIKCHGIVGSPVSDYASAGNGFWTTYLKLIRQREVLLDEDRLGLLFVGQLVSGPGGDYADVQTLIGTGAEAAAADNNFKFDEPYWFEPSLDFGTGEELNVILSWIKAGTHTMEAGLPDVGLILETIRD